MTSICFRFQCKILVQCRQEYTLWLLEGERPIHSSLSMLGYAIGGTVWDNLGGVTLLEICHLDFG